VSDSRADDPRADALEPGSGPQGRHDGQRGAPHRPVLVVGAGPVGLSAALALRAQGWPATVLEADPPDRQRPGSRAIFTHGTVLAVLERLRAGLGWALARHGLVWPTKRTLWRGREVFRRTYPPPPDNALPPFTSMPQVETEQHLLDACKQADVELVWDAPVTVAETHPGGVRLVTAGGEEWTAEYAVAADGARSAVRHALGIAMAGRSSANAFVIVDVDQDRHQPLPPERVFHYQHPAAGGRHVLRVPFAGGWRVDLQCRSSDDPEEFASARGMGSWLDAVQGPGSLDRVSWASTYRFHQVVAQAFTDAHRRVLLAGEAAHLFAPFGARGMNSGIVDADAAAAAVGEALSSDGRQAAQAAVDRFAAQRRAAAEHNRDAAGAALAHLQGRGLRTRAKQRAAAQLARRVDRAGKWLDTAPYGPRTPKSSGGESKY
jgi:3-(3-hydroxy-phenyl)propionate hydroxylase